MPLMMATLLALTALAALACDQELPASQPMNAVSATQAPPSASSIPTQRPSPTVLPTAKAASEEPAPTPISTLSPTQVTKRAPSPTPLPTPAHIKTPDRDLSELAARLRNAKLDSLPIEPAKPMSAGDRHDFWLTNLNDGSARTISATLRVVSDNAYWFTDDATTVDQAELEEAARLFERRVRPAIVNAFGDIRSPGIDGDPRLTILHSELDGAAGYYGASDEYPSEVHPHSNEREIIYIDSHLLRRSSDYYMSVLAHEFQHAVHFNQDTGEDSWVNEGLSELATEVSGYETASPDFFLPRPNTQLNYWPEESERRIPHYGASALFFRYLMQRIGGTARLKDLMTQPLDGIYGVDVFLQEFGLRFEDVFADWVVANYLDADDARFGYLNSDVNIRRARPLGEGKGREMSLPQFSARYHTLRTDATEGNLKFHGNSEARQIEADCVSEDGCWWSGRGDSINTRLTGEYDLAGLSQATLEYNIWHDIEDGWDYGYVEISDDDGRSWTILEGQYTSNDDVSGNAYGPGYTGRSRVWKPESIDITPFVGGIVLVRFEYVTDDAVYRDGFMVADISIPELEDEDDMNERPNEWIAEGFSQARAELPQRFIVQIIRTGAEGAFDVSRLDLNDDNFGEAILSELDAPDSQIVVVVSPTTPDTRHNANYTLEFLPLNGKASN